MYILYVILSITKQYMPFNCYDNDNYDYKAVKHLYSSKYLCESALSGII